MLAGSESIKVFKNRLNEHLSEVVQMKQSCLRNKGFGMETKLFNILSLPFPPKNYCFVGMLHIFPRKSELFRTSLCVTNSHLTSNPMWPSPPSPALLLQLSLHPPFLTSLHCRKSEGGAKGGRSGTGVEKETLLLLQGWGSDTHRGLKADEQRRGSRWEEAPEWGPDQRTLIRSRIHTRQSFNKVPITVHAALKASKPLVLQA